MKFVCKKCKSSKWGYRSMMNLEHYCMVCLYVPTRDELTKQEENLENGK